tara:strand:- start:272 stop:448 length:177 start_codon:yes stop_codon:yes gene_type:complete
MQTYQQFSDQANQLHKATLFSAAIKRKLKSAVAEIHSTDDTNQNQNHSPQHHTLALEA